MSIGTVVQRGSVIHVYDEDRNQISTIAAGSGPDCELEGYTAATVSIRRGNLIYMYDEHGRQLGTVVA